MSWYLELISPAHFQISGLNGLRSSCDVFRLLEINFLHFPSVHWNTERRFTCFFEYMVRAGNVVQCPPILFQQTTNF